MNQTDATVLQRNKFEKLYEEARENGRVLQGQSQLLSVSVEQLKEALAAHEKESARLGRALSRADSDKATLTREMNVVQSRARDLEAAVDDHEKREAALSRTIADLERQRDEVRRALRGVLNERDIIGTQLVRRNDEIRLLLAKVDVLQSTLTSGQEQYLQRADDVRLLKLEVHDLSHKYCDQILSPNVFKISSKSKVLKNLL